jgi:hypothetical protein
MFILGLFNDALSPSNFVASSNTMMINKHVEVDGHGIIWGSISAFAERTEENHINPQSG